jgi:hypothetical protein
MPNPYTLVNTDQQMRSQQQPAYASSTNKVQVRVASVGRKSNSQHPPTAHPCLTNMLSLKCANARLPSSGMDPIFSVAFTSMSKDWAAEY